MPNFAVLVAVVGTVAGALMAAFSYGMSRAPFWSERRPFALVALTAAGYCAFDGAMVLDVPDAVVAAAGQTSLAFGVLHGVAWIWYLAAAARRSLTAMERWTIGLGLAIALAGLVPGLLVSREIIVVAIDWAGITYRIAQPTLGGSIVYVYLVAVLAIVGVHVRRGWRGGWYDRFPIIGVAALTLLAANDMLVSFGTLQAPLLLDAGSVVVVVVTGILHQHQYANRVHRLEAASDELRREVEIRTAQLLDAQSRLATSERLAGMGRLASGVAHEVNNPASVVTFYLEQLREMADRGDGIDPRAGLFIERGLLAMYRIVRIVRQLLDAGRAHAPDATEVEPFLVAPVVQRAVERCAVALRTASMSIDVDPALAALGQPLIVVQVLEHLLTNAAEAVSAPGNSERSIVVRASRSGGRVSLLVADAGGGIPETVRPRLFEPFVTTKAVGRGSGLGLAVSLGLMRSQNGDLRLVASTAAGTTMALELPAAEMPAAARLEVAAETPADGSVSLLIIDDDDDVRKMLVEATKHVFSALAVGSIAEAFAALDSGRRVDAVLCDLMMPDGGAPVWIDACRRRGDAVLAGRTIVITGGPTTPENAAFVARHASRVLYKPFSIAQVREMVGHIAAMAPDPPPTRPS